MESAIIIGSGLGGLQCAYILAKQGYKVTVLEKHCQTGGCLQTFQRGGRKFDSGFHYVGGLDEGQSLRSLFDFFGLSDLPWLRMDSECFDEVVIGDKHYPFACGYGNFVERLSEHFPDQRENLKKYTAFLKEVGDNIFSPLNPDGGKKQVNDLFSQSAYGFLCETISDPLLRQVLSGTSLKMELQAETLPLYVFAQINNSFIQSAWKLDGGGDLIVKHLSDSILSMGGEIRTNSEVTAMTEKDGKIVDVEVNGEEVLHADWIISDIHPALTLSLIGETKCFRRIYRSRISSLKNTFGIFTANLCLKDGAIPYQNRNIFIHKKDADLWKPDESKTESVLVYYYPQKGSGGSATHIDLLSPMQYSGISQWQNLPVGQRGREYTEIKERKLNECLELTAGTIEGLKDGIDKIFTSTPLTYQSYTGTPSGSAYGIRKDYTNPIGTVLSPRSPIPNLIFTGQSLNLHGILGVSMTSLLSCSSILGLETLSQLTGIV